MGYGAESKSTMPKIPKGLKKGGWELAAYIYPNGDIFSIEDFSKVIGTYDIWYYSGNIPEIDAPKNTWIYDDEADSWDWDKILDKAKNQVNEDYEKLEAEEKKNCGCGQDPCVTYGAESFEAPRRKRLDFDWIGEDSSDKEWAKSGQYTIAAAIKKAKAEGWKPVSSQYWGNNAATRKSRMRREAKVWNLMSKSPQWKPWLKFLTERGADNEMSETMDIFRGKAYWKDKNRNSVSILGMTQDHGPWIYDEDRIYVPDHFAEDGGHQVLVKGNQALLLYYIADYDGPVSTPLMRKTFNLSPVKATKTAKKTTTRKSTAKVGRKSPTISATRRKIGTRMRGNDGKMWEVKKSGKSQRWMAGAESCESCDWEYQGSSLYDDEDIVEVSEYCCSKCGITTFVEEDGESEYAPQQTDAEIAADYAMITALNEYQDEMNARLEERDDTDSNVELAAFEAPKTMTKTQAKNKFIALAQPYWIKELTKLKEGFIQQKKVDEKENGESEYFEQYDYDIEDTNTYLKIAKSNSKIKNIIGCNDGDTVLREMIPDGFYYLINFPRENYDTWETTVDEFEGPKTIKKQLKALLPFIEGKPKAKAKSRMSITKGSKPGTLVLSKTGRKAPTISATKRKIGTRMRGNDGNMWEVKPAGKSQRWVRGAETLGSEQDAYTFAYSQGHNDGRKDAGYNHQLKSGKDDKNFRKVLNQRAESDEDGIGAKYMANPTGGSTGDQIISWENNGLSSPSGPPSDIFWAEGINKKGIFWIDTEESDETWDDETEVIEKHLSSQGYKKCGAGQFFENRTYAYVLFRFRKYLQNLAEKIKGYKGVVEDREYLEYMTDSQFVFSPWENKAKNKVALVWQFYDDEGFLISEPYYKYFSLTTPEWYHAKFELHIGEDYRYDSCPICDYKNPMKSMSDARKLAAHIYSHGPMLYASPFNDFEIEVPQPSWSDDDDEECLDLEWGNPMGQRIEIIESRLPYIYGFDVAEEWSPTKAQHDRYKKKSKQIKDGLRAAGFKPKRWG